MAPSSAIKWDQQWRAEGALEPARQGHFILSLVSADKDLALHELAEHLFAKRRVRGGRPRAKGVAHQSRAGTGEHVYTVGSPQALDRTLREVIIAGIRSIRGIRRIQTTSPISPGSSDGGLLEI